MVSLCASSNRDPTIIIMTKFSKNIGCNLTYFKNLTTELHVLYTLNTRVKFCVNQILFTIWSIRLYIMYNFKLQKFTI